MPDSRNITTQADFEYDPVSNEDFEEKEQRHKAEMPDSAVKDLASQAALLAPTGNVVDTYTSVSNDLKTTGGSPVLDSVEDSMVDEHNKRVVDTASILAYEGVVDPAELYQAAHNRIREYQPYMPAAISEEAIDTNEPSTNEAAAVFKSWSENTADDEIEEMGNLTKLAEETYEDFTLTWEMVGDALLTFLPFYESKAFAELGEEFLGGGKKGYVVPGEVLESLRQKAEGLTPSERVTYYKDMSSFLEENAGVMGGNEFIRVTALMEVFDETVGNSDPEDIDWARWGMDLAGLADLTIIGGAAMRGVKQLFKAPKLGSNVFTRVMAGNPKKAAKLAEAAAIDPRVAEALMETPETLRARYVLPKGMGWDSAATTEKVRQAILGADEASQEIVETVARLDDFINKEGVEAAKALQDELFKSAGSSAWVADSSITKTPRGWGVNALMGNSDESGWATLEAAQKANKEIFGGNGKVVPLQKKTGKLGKPMIRKGEPANEYFIKMDREAKLVFTDDDYGIVAGGKARSYAFDPDTQFASTVTVKSNVIFDQYKVLEKGLEANFVPLAELSNQGRSSVSKMLSRGLQREKVYSTRELTRLFKAEGVKDVDKAVGAYKEARKGFDTMYVLENKIFRDSLTREGFNSVIKHKGNVVDFAKPISQEAASSVKRVYDPATEGFVDIADIAKIYDDGNEVVQLRSAMKIGDEQSRFVVRSKDVTFDEIPLKALNKRDGWLPTRYKENYFIEKTFKVTENGKQVDKVSVIGVSRSKVGGQDWVGRLQANAEEGVEYAVKHDRTLGHNESEKLAADLHKNTGKLFFSRRGELLKHEDGSLARIQDPLESAINGIRTVAKRTGMDGFFGEAKARYVNTYGDLTDGQFLRAVPKGDLTDPRLAQADAMYNHIQHLEGFSGNVFDEKMKFIKLGEWLDRKGWDKGGDIARAIAGEEITGKGVIGQARALNFNINLGSDNPFRQMLLQPSQLLLTASLDPVNAIGNINTGRIVSKLSDDVRYKKDLSIEAYDWLAKKNFTTMSGKELKELVEEFRKTGLGQAVTSHQQARDAASSLSLKGEEVGAIRKGASAVSAPFKAALGGFKNPTGIGPKKIPGLRAGFERGEEINLGGHWMLARSRWMKKNPNLNPLEHTLQIAGEARSLALSMTGAGDLAYSKGLMSIPLQYFSIRHKTLMALTTNQNFTKGEKLSMALGQLVMWGPEGLGMKWAYDSLAREHGVTIPDYMEDGMMETAINGALSSVFDEDVDLDIGGSFSLLGGVFNENLIAETGKLIAGDGDFTDLAFGATKSNMNRIGNFLTSSKILLNTAVSGVEVDKMAGMALDDFLSISSGYNRFAKAHTMLNTGHWVTSKGEKILPASEIESYIQGLLGIQSNQVDAYYQLTNAISPQGKARKTAIQETADDYYKVALRITNDALGKLDAGAPYQEVIARHQALLSANNIMIANLGPDAEEVMGLVRERMQKSVSKNKKDELITKLTNLSVHKRHLNHIDFAKDQGLMTEQEHEVLGKIYNQAWGFEQ